MRRLAILALIALPLCAETPVGIVLERGDGAIFRAGIESPLQVVEGVELFAGDRVLGISTTVIALCSTKKIERLPPGHEYVISAAGTGGGSPTNVCTLPDMPPIRLAAAVPRRAPRFSADSAQRRLDAEIAVEKMGPAPPLLASIAVAERLHQSGFLEEAIAAYDEIHRRWPLAAWTSAVTEALVVQSDQRAASLAGTGNADSGRAAELNEADLPSPIGITKTYAVLIGVSKFQHGGDDGIKDLDFADRDAELFVKYLQSPRGGNLHLCDASQEPDGCEILVLTNEQATRAAIINAFADKQFVDSHAGRHNALWIFVASHGREPISEQRWQSHAPITRGAVILTHDSDAQDPKTTALGMGELGAAAAKASQGYGRVVVFADVCHANYIETEARAVNNAAQKAFLFSRRSGLFMATDEAHRAMEYESLHHGVFSYYTILTMSQPSKEGSLSLYRLGHDVEEKVVALTREQQIPHAWGPNTSMPVVDDLSPEAITLDVADPLASGTKPREPGTGRDRGGSSAAPPRKGLVGLEDRGQQVILKYLNGDQVPVSEDEFLNCARDFDAALQLAPGAAFDESRALFCRARALIFPRPNRDPADFRRAIDLLQRAILLDGQRGYAYNALGIAYLEHAASDPANLRLAEAALHDAIRYAPNWTYPWHNLALVLTERGDYDGAIAAYRHAMTLGKFPYLSYNLGLLYQRINRPREAEANYRAALKLATAQRGQYMLARAGDRHPEEAEAQNALGTLADRGKNRKAAEDFYRRAIKSDDQIVSARSNLAKLIAARDKASTEPETLWKEALRLNPHDGAARLAFADYLRDRGRVEESAKEYQTLLAEAPDSEGARRGLAALTHH